jgi:hypothetical protein
MSYEERGQWVYVVANLVTFAGYVAVIAGQAAGTPVTQIDYVPAMLWAIGIGVGLSIAGRILIEIAAGIANPDDPHTADVRDRDIGRLGEYFGGTLLGVAMVVPFVLALAEFEHFWIANAMYAAFAISALVGAATKLVAYRRGFQ